MNGFIEVLLRSLQQVGLAFVHNWPFLLFSVLVSVALKLYVSTDKVSAYLMQHKKAGVFTATLAAVLTPFCSCGTTAVVLGMMASTIPWGPIVAFMVASPLSSPEELIYSAGVFGWPFAITFFVASIVLGLIGGWVASRLESLGWLKNQSRFAVKDIGRSSPASCSCSSQSVPVRDRFAPVKINRPHTISRLQPVMADESCCAVETTVSAPSTQTACGCGAKKPEDEPTELPGLRQFIDEVGIVGFRLLWMFGLFAFIGYLLNNLIPAEWMAAIFGAGKVYSVPLAATLGLPFYLNSESSLPLVRAMIEGGMNQGAALAFLIAGAGTSIGAISGALTIARWKVIAIVVGTLWIGAMMVGMFFNWVFPLGIV